MISHNLARLVAEFIHCNQKYDEYDYIYHLDAVNEVLIRFGYDDSALGVAAYLHDSVEDAGIKLSLIKKHFGQTVCDLVWAVTNEAGVNRKERNLKTYPKIAGTPNATALKLADRIANVEQSKHKGNKNFVEMYAKEYEVFKYALQVKDEHSMMWAHLDNLMGR